MSENSPNKYDNILKPAIFAFAFIICISLGVVIGTNQNSPLTWTGVIIASLGVGIGVLITFFLAKLIWPGKVKSNWLAYISGILTILSGIAATGVMGFLLGFIVPGGSPDFTPGLVIYFIMALIWVVFMIWKGMEAPVFPAFIAGGILGALLFVGLTTFIPGLFGLIFKEPGGIQEGLDSLRIAFAIPGAFIGSLGAAAARASGFTLGECKRDEEGEKS